MLSDHFLPEYDKTMFPSDEPFHIPRPLQSQTGNWADEGRQNYFPEMNNRSGHDSESSNHLLLAEKVERASKSIFRLASVQCLSLNDTVLKVLVRLPDATGCGCWVAGCRVRARINFSDDH